MHTDATYMFFERFRLVRIFLFNRNQDVIIIIISPELVSVFIQNSSIIFLQVLLTLVMSVYIHSFLFLFTLHSRDFCIQGAAES